MIKGSVQMIAMAVCFALQDNKYEWQISGKELKLKCRSKINESDLWDDYSCDMLIEEFMKQNIIKFYIQILKWNKDIADSYYIYVQVIKCDNNCFLMH